MNNKARDRADRRKKKNMTPFWVALCTLLVLGAVVTGFLYAGDLIGEVDSEVKAQKEIEEPEVKSDIPSYDSELFFGVSPDVGIIDSLFLCRLDSQKGTLRFDLIDPGMSFSMSGSLYSELSMINIRIPQTGRFGGLLGYCTGEGAYDAGRKIAAEMLGQDIGHYTSFDSRVLAEYISVSGKEGERSLSLKIDTTDAKSPKYGTSGTMMGFIKELFGKAIESDRTIDERLVYLEALDALENSDITVETVPVKKHNETMELDTQGWRKISNVK
ncbi:MAG: hypothetical protein K6E95_03150 [Lachnospiraceae bacterium]|nr:hypothetical protein [Lachnospiraceae bacterium]